MAVVDPCLQKEWDEWRRGMEKKRRISWIDRMRRWVKVKADDEEEDNGFEEEGEESSEEEEVDGESGEEKGDEAEGKEALGIEEDKGESNLEELVDNIKEEDREMNEEGRMVELEEGDGNEAGKNEEYKEEEMRVNEENETEQEEKEGERGLVKGFKESEVGSEEEDGEVNEADEMGDGEEKEEVDESEDKSSKTAEGKDEVDPEVKEKEEMDGEEENGVKEAQEEEEGDNKVTRRDNDREEEGEEEARQVRDEENEEEEFQEVQNERRNLGEQFRQQMGRIQVENIQQNQERAEQEDETVKDEESDSAESENDKDSGARGYENEHYNLEHDDTHEREDREEKLQVNEKGILRAWISSGKSEEEDKSGIWTTEEGTVTESWATQEDFEEDDEDVEESPHDEGAEHLVDEDEDWEDKVKIYRKDDYPTDVFLALNEFRDSSILTDLTLNTEDGKSYSVHSPVLAAVSSLIWKNLNRIKKNRENIDETRDGVHAWSVSLGPEVDHVGLEAVVEFAYTGLISCLNKDNVDQIKSAAQKMGALRVLDLCSEQEEMPTKTGVQKKKEGISAAQQMMINLQSIKRLWTDRVGCDVTLEAGGASLHAHRAILSVSSDYFRGMFTLGMKEAHQPCVTLPFLSASELEALISCSYSGAVPLTWSCVFELTTTALQLQYQPALSLCLNFLQKEINAHSCLDVISFAEAYEMPQLLEFADDFVLRQFQKVACTSKFQDLPARQLLKYLNSFSLCVPSELVVFKAVVAWIQAKPRIRLRLAKELMKTIHFPLMTFKEFKEVQAQNMWSDHSLAELYEAVFEDFCCSEATLQTQCRIYLPKESLVLIGGDQISEDLGTRRISRELWFGNSLRNHIGIRKAMEWRRLGEMPEPERFSHEVAVLRGQLYVFGGKKYYGIGDTLNSVYRYDPLQNSWEKLAEMQEKRCSFTVVVLDEKIYAIGGYCDPDYIDSVEQYCPATNSWSFTRPLDLPLGGHVAKVSQSQIFVSGGQNDDYLCIASMFLYHPETGSSYMANMSRPRAHHCMETLDECLYVAGGITTDDDFTVKDYLACEVYSPATDSWTAFMSLPVPHVGAGSAVLEGKFYILGGYNQEDYSDTKLVHRYNTATQTWENMGKMPGPNNDIRASVLCLPQHVRS